MSTKNLFNKLENNNFNVSSYAYPSNLGSEEFIHAVMFSIYKRTDSSVYSSNNSRRVSGVDMGGQARSFRTNNPLYNTKKSLVGSTSRLSETISLYMPGSVSSDYGISYNNTDITKILKYSSNLRSSLPALKQAYLGGNEGTLMNNIMNVLGAATSDAKSAISNINTDTIKNMTGSLVLSKDETYDALSLFSKIAKNPHMEYIFEKVNNRSFNFSFTFYPKNATESRNVYNIIRLFKRTAIPRINEMSGMLGVYYDYPHVYDITFISNGTENQWLHKIATCILTNIKTGYGDDGDPTFNAFNDLDGKGTPPTKITLELTFEEMEVMSQQRIDEGY